MSPKQAKALIVLVVGLLLLLTGVFGGYTLCKRAQYKGIINQQSKDAIAIMEHVDKKEEVVKNVEAAINETQLVNDPSGCLDVNSPDEYLNKLLKSDGRAQSGFN